METTERAKLDTYFGKIARAFTPPERPASLLITHLLPERPAFVSAVATVSDLRAVLPKPKSVSDAARREVEQSVAVDELTRELFADQDTAVAYLETRAADQDLVLLDVGGYIAPALDAVCDRFSGRVLGVVEDTENGHQRYADQDKLPCPVISVARSPLKDPEDFLVGQSCVFSTEALLRARGDILHGRPALVIGFGKLGSSIARLLHAKGIHVTVYDIDPVRRAQALSQGFGVARDRDLAISQAGLVMCATGSLSLRGEDFPTLRNGAYVATVTSSEDELEPDGLPGGYTRSSVGDHITGYATTGHYFYLLNGGNAVNFLHGASVGPFIYLVQAEILAGAHMLTRGDLGPGMHGRPHPRCFRHVRRHAPGGQARPGAPPRPSRPWRGCHHPRRDARAPHRRRAARQRTRPGPPHLPCGPGPLADSGCSLGKCVVGQRGVGLLGTRLGTGELAC